jgi:hypothetical protein
MSQVSAMIFATVSKVEDIGEPQAKEGFRAAAPRCDVIAAARDAPRSSQSATPPFVYRRGGESSMARKKKPLPQ